MITKNSLFVICLVSIFGIEAYSQGTFVEVRGDVQIFKPVKTTAGRGPFVTYNDQLFKSRRARVGQRIQTGEVVHTGNDGKTKIIFKNGDHFAVGPATSYQMYFKDKDGKAKTNLLNMFYGKVRAMVKKEGPRAKLKIKTPSAVAGVRGTDFFVKHSVEGTQLTVLRGEVAVKRGKEETEVKSGQKVTVEGVRSEEKINIVKSNENENEEEVTKKDSSKRSPSEIVPLKIEEVTKQELLVIQKESTVHTKAEEKTLKMAKAMPVEVKKEIEELKKKAVEAIASDIPDKELSAKIKSDKNVDLDKVSTLVVSDLYKKAPSKGPVKPSENDLEDIGEDVYEKYFK